MNTNVLLLQTKANTKRGKRSESMDSSLRFFRLKMQQQFGSREETNLILYHPHTFLPHLVNDAKYVNVIMRLDVLKYPIQRNECT